MGNEVVKLVPKGIEDSWKINSNIKEEGIEKAKEFLETVKTVSDVSDTIKTVVEVLDIADGIGSFLKVLEAIPLVGVAAGIVSVFISLFCKDTSNFILDQCKADVSKEISEFLMISLQAKFRAAQIEISYGKNDSAHGIMLEALLMVELVFENSLSRWSERLDSKTGIILAYRLRQIAILIGKSFLKICDNNHLETETNRVNNLTKKATKFLLDLRFKSIILDKKMIGDAYVHVQYGDKLFNVEEDEAFASVEDQTSFYNKSEEYRKETMMLWENDLNKDL